MIPKMRSFLYVYCWIWTVITSVKCHCISTACHWIVFQRSFVLSKLIKISRFQWLWNEICGEILIPLWADFSESKLESVYMNICYKKKSINFFTKRCLSPWCRASVSVNWYAQKSLDSPFRRGIFALHVSEGDEEPGHPLQISCSQTLRLSLPLRRSGGGERRRLHVSPYT